MGSRIKFNVFCPDVGQDKFWLFLSLLNRLKTAFQTAWLIPVGHPSNLFYL